MKPKAKVSIKIPAPHSPEQDMIMRAFYGSQYHPDLRFVWVACGSKFGKSLAASSAMCLAAPRSPGTFWRWVAPIYSQAKNVGMDYIVKLMPRDYIKSDRSDLTVSIPSIATKIQFAHGQKPETLEGVATHGNVLDECAKMTEDVFSSCLTTTTQTKGKFLCISTPLGKGWFYKKCMEAKEEQEWALKNGRNPTQLFITAPTSANPFIDKSIIEAARKNMPDRLFKQYFMAEFVDESELFRGFRDLIYGLEEIHDYGTHQEFLDDGHETKSVVIGADWGRTKDWTVFIAIDYEANPAKIIGYVRMQGRTFTEQIVDLINFAREFKFVSLVLHDKSSFGSAIDEQLNQTELPATGVFFTQSAKQEMVTRLIHSVEQRRFRIPNIKTLKRELDSYEMSITKTGQMSFSAPSGGHDDTIAALMLANEAYLRYAETEFNVNILEDLPKTTPVKSYYEEQIQDDIEDDDEKGIILEEINPYTLKL